MRLFVAADLSEVQIAELGEVVTAAQLKLGDDALRWIPRENWHGTLAFLGSRESEEIDEIRRVVGETVKGCEVIRCQPDRLKPMPHRSSVRLLALWAFASTQLSQLYADLNVKLGVKDRRRRFQFHVTVARVRPHKVADLQGLDNLESLLGREWTLPSVTLYESVLRSGGSKYRPIQRWQLSTE